MKSHDHPDDMFRGRFAHTIDPKGRLSVPAKFRDVLAQSYDDQNLVVVPDERCLQVYPVAEWQRIEAKLREQSMFNPRVSEISRLFMSRARDVAVDSAGRMLLPPDARREAGLDKDVWLVAGGLPRFEVWDRGRFEDYERAEQHKLPDLQNELSSLGV